jgi:hypothetical protein
MELTPGRRTTQLSDDSNHSIRSDARPRPAQLILFSLGLVPRSHSAAVSLALLILSGCATMSGRHLSAGDLRQIEHACSEILGAPAGARSPWLPLARYTVLAKRSIISLSFAAPSVKVRCRSLTEQRFASVIRIPRQVGLALDTTELILLRLSITAKRFLSFHPERPNQSLQPTASRRTIQFSDD